MMIFFGNTVRDFSDFKSLSKNSKLEYIKGNVMYKNGHLMQLRDETSDILNIRFQMYNWV